MELLQGFAYVHDLTRRKPKRNTPFRMYASYLLWCEAFLLMETTMDYNKLMIEAAEKFKSLSSKSYTVITGQKKKLHETKIIITADGFKHLTGLHKARNYSVFYSQGYQAAHVLLSG